MGINGSEKTPRIFTRTIAIWAMLIASPVFIVFAVLGKPDEGIGVWICTGIVIGSGIIWWDLKRSVWFWMTILFASFLQVPFILFVPWDNRYMSFVSLLPFGFVDYAIVYGCMTLIEKKTQGGKEQPSIQ